MQFPTVEELLQLVNPSELVSLDTDTIPSPGFRKISTGETVMLFNTLGKSGYEQLVRSRLKAMGKNPLAFTVGDLPWGERIGNSPIIHHKGEHYLQAIIIKPGKMQAFIGETELFADEIPSFFYDMDKLKRDARRQGLPLEQAVIIRCYKLNSLREVRLQDKKFR